MQKKLYPINIRVDHELKEDLRQIASEEDRPLANMIVRVLREFVDVRKAERQAKK